MDACEIANFLATELFMQQLVSLDGGIHSGVPTRTTATLTPTTLRNIEQTFMDLTNDQPTTVACQAGFVAPLPSFGFDDQQQDQESLSSNGSGSSSSWQTPPPSTSDELLQNGSNFSSVPSTNKRNMGGRRPKNASNMTPAEEEKRKVRRERNKLAAARCRKRRVDQTNELIDKVTVLEKEKEKLQNDIQELQGLKEELQFCLDSHRAQCRLALNNSGLALGSNERKTPLMEFKSPALAQLVPQIVEKIKIEPHDSSSSMDDCGPPSPKRILLTNSNPIISSTGAINHQSHHHNNNQLPLPPVSIHHQTTTNNNNTTSIMTPTLNTPTLPTRPNRPSSLAVQFPIIPSHGMGQHRNIADMAGVSITTPSNGVIFNFDSLMEGGTGLTPVSQPLMPNCSSMNRNPLDLATPTTEPSKLVSL